MILLSKLQVGLMCCRGTQDIKDSSHTVRYIFLRTAVLDFIIQSAASPPDVSEEHVPPMTGSLGSEALISSANLTASYKQRQVFTLKLGMRIRILSPTFASTLHLCSTPSLIPVYHRG
jgi:hypothetical protein